MERSLFSRREDEKTQDVSMVIDRYHSTATAVATLHAVMPVALMISVTMQELTGLRITEVHGVEAAS